MLARGCCTWAITRNLLHQAGTIAYSPHEITVELDRPNSPKIERCLSLVTEQLNTQPAHLAGDTRPITYTIT